jgi:hypothetical protein
MKNYEIAGSWLQHLGSSKIGGSIIPANLPITITYENKSVDTDKTFIGIVEYLY